MIVDSVPGVVRMKLGPGGAHSRGQTTWFGLKRPDPLMLELHLHQLDAIRGNKLIIQAVFRPQSISQLTDSIWRERCTRAYIDLRSHLMGTDE
jgi:hypothetical protein